MATNLTTFFQDSTLRAAREPEVPLASFENGMNPAASCAPGVGINTGDYAPKESDWPHIKGLGESQQLGEDISGINVDDVLGPNTIIGFAPATAETAPDGVINADVEGWSSINRTGKTIPAGEWAWGVIDNP